MKSSVLFVLHLPPPVHGAAMVGKYIFDSKVINDTFHCRFINLATANNLENIGRFSFSKIVSLFGLIRHIRNEMRRLKPNLVYITPNASGGAFYKDFLVVEAIKFWGGKVVLHFHNKGVEKNSRRKINNYLYKLFFRNAKIVLLSKSLYPDLRKYVKEDDVYYCSNGIPEIETKDKEHHPICRILFLSNLIISKGLLDLLDACKILSDRNLAFKCDIVGAETDEMSQTRLEQEIRNRGVASNVEYLGKKFGEEKNECFENSDIFVFPTYYPNECFPIVLLEAMQHGLPCVSTDEGAIPDIIDDGKTGIVVQRHNPNSIANAIQPLIESESLRKVMGNAARSKYDKFYRLDTFEQQLSAILRQLV